MCQWSLGMSLGPVAELERYGNIGLAVRRQQGNLPPFVLHHAGKAKPRFQQEVSIQADVILRSPARKKLTVNLAVAEFNANFLLCAQPVVAAYRFTLRCPAEPGSR